MVFINCLNFLPFDTSWTLPTVLTDGDDIHGRYLEIVRQEHQREILLHVPIFYPSQFFGVELLAFRPLKLYRLVTAQPLDLSTFLDETTLKLKFSLALTVKKAPARFILESHL